MSTTTIEIKDKIAEARKTSGYSQLELSKQIGVSDKAVSAYEVGRSTPPIKVLKKISKATNKPLRYFLDTEEEKVVISKQDILEKLTAIEKEMNKLRKTIEQYRERE